MALTDIAIKAAKAKEKPYKMGDAGGLFLLVQPTGGKLWRLKYRIEGKEKKLALGAYPDVGLADARKRRDNAKAELADGKDPAREKVRRKERSKIASGNSFSIVAAEFINKRIKEGWSPPTQAKAAYLMAYLTPVIGRIPVSDITPIDLLPIFKRAEAKGNLETARRLMQLCSQIFRYAIATARLASDPTRDLRGAITASKPKHHGAIIDPVKVGELLRAIDGYSGHYVCRYALKLAPHLFVRPGELRFAEWAELDLGAAVYTVRVECRCRREAFFEAHGLWWKFQRKSWSDDFREAKHRFYCKSCSQRYGRKVRPVIMETSDQPARHHFPLPDEREWKRAVSRFRG
ncbi:Symbiosis island integrase [Sphingobium herbicidovorans NBRC 16415]|uniref:Symbiosis island integrase n=1 Tax=Sphingobium herbicidovorans (strain ATCC 700291 / DSM 11019 / CCUG 56400 / KCTC 2939 / LMG 18315 / NBRC 16415 / MH) TaxID=1219045 RepID=A0A086PEQ6_SPHHM|nr:integrase arm-type DNA-binding domain-containing protein [Sphingobium herbicidovorans]KFG91874.1 Symbiosis island integrase [Sphingobium herbicidovorans NBRC 16415]